MIDTHCHLLPGLDDGPVSELESVQLARQLVADGVTYILCTPHFSRTYPTSADRARDALARMRRHLIALDIPLELGLAAEVSPELLTVSAAGLEQRSVEGRHVIVELDRGAPVGIVPEAISTLRELGLAPVFAHPERCRAIRREHGLIADARAEGALFQVVAPSLAGRWGEDVAKAAWGLLDAAEADLVATDAHRPSPTRRTLRTVLLRIAESYGDDVLRELTERAPGRLVGRVKAASGGSRNGSPAA
jgi:protein-tyrosine phosphatase